MNAFLLLWGEQIAFTGSGPTGVKIMTAAAQLVKVRAHLNNDLGSYWQNRYAGGFSSLSLFMSFAASYS